MKSPQHGPPAGMVRKFLIIAKKNYDRKILEVSSLLIVFKLINSIYIPIDGMDTHAGVSDKQSGKVKMAKDSDSGKVTNTNTSF